MTHRYCAVCQEPIEGTLKFCTSCGALLNDQNEVDESATELTQDLPAKNHAKRNIVIGVLVVVALVCGGTFYCAYDSGMLQSTDFGSGKTDTFAAKKNSGKTSETTSKKTNDSAKKQTTDKTDDKNHKMTYDFESQPSEVEFVYHNSEQDTDLDEVWTYVQFSNSQKQSDSVLDDLNKTIKDDFERELQDAKKWDADSGSGPQCISHRETVTYIKDEYAVVRTERYLTMWGPHGDIEVSGKAYDLTSGDEVSMPLVTGKTYTEMESAAREAIERYLEDDPSDIYSGSQLDEYIDEIVNDDSRYYVTKDGLLINARPAELGSYQYGGKDIVVAPIDGSKASVGTNLYSKYSEMK